MNGEETGSIQHVSAGTAAGSHPVLPAHAALVGPTAEGRSNRLTTSLIPVACWRVDDLRFAYGSSFIGPDLRDEINSLFELRAQHKAEVKTSNPVEPAVIYPPLAIFGHADPVGRDDYNKTLSGRRAAAVYGLLVRDAELWEELYSRQVGGDKWDVKSVQVMLHHLGFSDAGAAGKMDQQTREDVKKFQKVKGLTADGDPGPKTRKVLFLAYMDSLCGADFVLDKKDDFLARGADAGGKGDYQGCGEFNPLQVFSQAEEDEYAKAENKARRDAENAPNRRVMVLLFRPGSRVSAEKWPCPRAKEGAGGCRKRLWSDGERRRGTRLPDRRRNYQETADTFACRFYDRLTSRSPCEQVLEGFEIRLYDTAGRFIAAAPFEITLGSRRPFSGSADQQGVVSLRDVRVPDTCLVKWGFKPQRGEAPALIFSLNMLLSADDQGRQEEARMKLNNLGYLASNPSVNVENFQRDYGHLADPHLPPTGDLDEQTMRVLRDVYAQCADDLRDSRVT